MFYSYLKYGLVLCQTQPENPGQAASTITEDGIAASEAVAQSIDKLWDDVLGGGLYSAIANLGIFFAVGTLLIFIVQWTKEMIDGDSSKGFTELIWTIVVIVLLANNGQQLVAVTKGLRGIINQTNQTLLVSTSASIQLQEAYQQVMLKTGKTDAIESLINQCNTIADPTQQTECLQNAARQAKQIEAEAEANNRPSWLKNTSDFFNTNIFQLAVRGWLLALALLFSMDNRDLYVINCTTRTTGCGRFITSRRSKSYFCMANRFLFSRNDKTLLQYYFRFGRHDGLEC